MEISDALALAGDNRFSVLTTLRRNGRPQLSSVCHSVSSDGVIRVSFSTNRAKYHNLRREPWAALHVSLADFAGYVVLEADVELSPVATSPDDAVVRELVDHHRVTLGEHPNWDDFRARQVREQHVVLRLHPTYAYGMTPLTPQAICARMAR